MMSIPPNSPWRGAAAFLPQPLQQNDELAAQCLVEAIYDFNVRCSISTNLPDIEYRGSDGDRDIVEHVFRWDSAPYDFVFQNGFEARRQAGTSTEMFYNLERYVNSGGRPLDTRRNTTHAFVSTTRSSRYHPSVNPGTVNRVYRYEIYAPGGILVSDTLDDLYHHPGQDEVAFPAGIAPQYIRSAQIFELSCDRGSQFTRRTRVNTILYTNRNFSPQSHPQRRLRILRPVRYYRDENRVWRPLQVQEVPDERRKRSVDDTTTSDDDLIEYYINGVVDADNYLDSAFRSTRKNEVYMFIKGEYVLVNYAPGSTDDRIINGPHLIGSSFSSLVDTPFAEYGIDAAFGCHDNGDNNAEAMIFCGNLCARIDYAPGTTDDRIIKGPKTIRQMFPFFKGTDFERGIDAAFESSVPGEAYLFKGENYALINYSDEPEPRLIAIRLITQGFPCLSFDGSLFEKDIGAAFASHVENEVYLFKENEYLLLHFTPGETNDYIIGGPEEIVPTNWPSLKEFLPHKNRGLDFYGDELLKPIPQRDQDDQ